MEFLLAYCAKLCLIWLVGITLTWIVQETIAEDEMKSELRKMSSCMLLFLQGRWQDPPAARWKDIESVVLVKWDDPWVAA